MKNSIIHFLPLFLILPLLVCCTPAQLSSSPDDVLHSAQSSNASHSYDSTPDQSAFSSEQADTSSSQTQVSASELPLPFIAADGALEITALFQSSIPNPDCGFVMGENTASLEVKNRSGQHLASAAIQILLTNGQSVFFHISDLPAGQTIWAFSPDNTPISSDVACSSISAQTSFEDHSPLLDRYVNLEINGTQVLVTNISEKNLEDLDISFHCVFEDVFFGGTVYSYHVDTLAPNESATLDVSECYLGEAAAVRIAASSF